jgi:hypothetical protein
MLLMDKIFKELSKTFQDDSVEITQHFFDQFATSSIKTPIGIFHLDGVQSEYIYLNLWIARKKVTGRPLVFVKGDSTTQKADPSSEDPPAYIFDPEHKISFVPDMEQGQIIAFLGNEVWHGSPVLNRSFWRPFRGIEIHC